MTMKLYGDKKSGNCYKIQLLLAFLRRPYEWVDVDMTKNESRSADFLRLNPVGEIPLLELDDGRCVPESNAILCYLAEGTPFLPADPWARVQALRWMFFEQNNHVTSVAAARFILHHLRRPEHLEQKLQEKLAAGNSALEQMERHLGAQEWFAGDGCTVADISLYAYTHVAEQSGFDLARFPRLRGWLERVRAMPGYVAMDDGPLVWPERAA